MSSTSSSSSSSAAALPQAAGGNIAPSLRSIVHDLLGRAQTTPITRLCRDLRRCLDTSLRHQNPGDQIEFLARLSNFLKGGLTGMPTDLDASLAWERVQLRLIDVVLELLQQARSQARRTEAGLPFDPGLAVPAISLASHRGRSARSAAVPAAGPHSFVSLPPTPEPGLGPAPSARAAGARRATAPAGAPTGALTGAPTAAARMPAAPAVGPWRPASLAQCWQERARLGLDSAVAAARGLPEDSALDQLLGLALPETGDTTADRQLRSKALVDLNILIRVWAERHAGSTAQRLAALQTLLARLTTSHRRPDLIIAATTSAVVELAMANLTPPQAREMFASHLHREVILHLEGHTSEACRLALQSALRLANRAIPGAGLLGLGPQANARAAPDRGQPEGVAPEPAAQSAAQSAAALHRDVAPAPAPRTGPPAAPAQAGPAAPAARPDSAPRIDLTGDPR